MLSSVARYRILAGEPQALEVGRAALAIADELGLDDVRAQAHITIGTARNLAGDDGGVEDIEAGIAIAEAAGSPEAARGYSNLTMFFYVAGDPRALEVTQRALAMVERAGIAQGVLHVKSNLADLLYLYGRWDEALALADESLAAGGSRNRVEPWLRVQRAYIRLARDDVDRRRGGRRTGRRAGPGGVGERRRPGHVPRSRARSPLRRATSRLRAASSRSSASTGSPSVPDNGTRVLELVERLGLADAYLRSAEGRLAENRPWIHAAAHYLRGDHLRAADVYASIGSRTDEAYARLRAARALAAEGRRPEADAELAQALAFYRSVGATRFIREAEALLAETA